MPLHKDIIVITREAINKNVCIFNVKFPNLHLLKMTWLEDIINLERGLVMLIVFSGCHGTGKSTFVNKLRERTSTPFLEELIVEKSDVDIVLRQKQNIEKHGYKAELHRGRIMFTERSILDVYAYSVAFRELNWLTEKQFKEIEDLCKIRFDEELNDSIHIIFQPIYEVHKERLLGRIERNGPKWNEQDESYLVEVRKAYLQIYNEFKDKYPMRFIEEFPENELDINQVIGERLLN